MSGRTLGFRSGCILVVAVLAVIIAGSWWAWVKTAHGFSARAQPSGIESWLAGLSRRLALPRGVRKVTNPYPAPTAQELAGARALFLARCAECHGPNGGGQTPLGRNLYPKPPDLRSPGTQDMSAGALFWTIRNGVRLSAMPAWPELSRRQTWMLVDFIRSLPAPH